ncbi:MULTISPECIES: hypothetical protein [Bacillus]|uniref:hypothetical protein n=1 Tax=Bacillus TaxID=1386 RepID=UPI0022819AA0|nr:MULTISPECIES: hypothetical protein [Bacillus]MCY8074907.1 hypothetical protein [Bacillus haynesii]MDE1384361.1 hypothetical protein [Bacillus paralicheniformis]
MVYNTELNALIDRLKNDDKDYENVNPGSWGLTAYLKTLIDNNQLQDSAAIGSAKKAVTDGVSLLSDAQLKAIALDMLNNDLYMKECPNCFEIIAWGDMRIALFEGQCYHCVYQQEKIEQE